MITYTWGDFERELDLWQAAGLQATFWWRDDDVTAASTALDQLLDLTRQASVSPALAAIPTHLCDELRHRLAGTHAHVLQHGYAHQSHAVAGEKKAEFGSHRPQTVMIAELVEGRNKLRSQFNDLFIPVLVPPWNRYDRPLIRLLTEAGFTGISAMWARPAASRDLLPLEVNTHADPIAWRDDRGFVGLSVVLEQLISHLRLRREVVGQRGEPTGLLTHHLDHVSVVWDFCEQLAYRINTHPAAYWCSAADIWNNQSKAA